MDSVWVILFIIGAIPITILITAFSQEKKIQSNRPTNFLYSSKITYLCGLPDKISEKDYFLEIYTGKIKLEEVYTKNSFVIYTNNILDSRIVSEKYIQEQITLGRVIALGFFALGAKKRKEGYNNYLELTIDYQGKEEKVLFAISGEQTLLKVNDIIRTEIQKRKEQDVV